MTEKACFLLISVFLFLSCNDHCNTSVTADGFSPESGRTYNIGHRGTGVNSSENPYPENTLISFNRALAEGADFVELDVLFSADGTLTVLHDEELDRVSDCSGCVSGKTDAELGECTVFSGMAEGDTDSVYLLNKVLDDIAQELFIDIEIKSYHDCPSTNGDDPSGAVTIAEKVVELVLEKGCGDRVMITSFDLDALKRVEKLAPCLYTGYLYLGGDKIATALENNIDAILPSIYELTEEITSEAKEAGLGVFAWTVNIRDDMIIYIEWGVNGIITDEPDVLAALLKLRKPQN